MKSRPATGYAGEGEGHEDGGRVRRAQKEAGDGHQDDQALGSVRDQAIDALRVCNPPPPPKGTCPCLEFATFLHSSP